jgi:hypothetical protein
MKRLVVVYYKVLRKRLELTPVARIRGPAEISVRSASAEKALNPLDALHIYRHSQGCIQFGSPRHRLIATHKSVYHPTEGT